MARGPDRSVDHADRGSRLTAFGWPGVIEFILVLLMLALALAVAHGLPAADGADGRPFTAPGIPPADRSVFRLP
jgi:hypothetical protein